MAIGIGKQAPDFTLEADDGRQVSLEELRGRKVVLYFYPKDNTPGCTAEACAFREMQPAFKKSDAVVIGISRDSRNSHERFKERQRLGFTLLSDPDAAVHRKYAAWGEKTLYGKTIEGALRTTVLIGPDGVVERIWPKVKVDGHAEEVLAALAGDRGEKSAKRR